MGKGANHSVVNVIRLDNGDIQTVAEAEEGIFPSRWLLQLQLVTLLRLYGPAGQSTIVKPRLCLQVYNV